MASIPDPDTISESLPDAEDSTDEYAARCARLKRSAVATKTFLRALGECRKLLDKLAGSCLENKPDAEQKINARESRQREAVFSAAKAMLETDHPSKKAIEEALGTTTDPDPEIVSCAQDIKAKVFEPLDALISQALQNINDEQSSDSQEHFTEAMQNLMGELDLQLKELGERHKQFATQWRQARIGHLMTARNIAIAAVTLTALVVGAVGYIVKVREKPGAMNVAAPAMATAAAQKKESAAPLPQAMPEPAKPVVAANPASAPLVDPHPTVAPTVAPAAVPAMVNTAQTAAAPQPATPSRQDSHANAKTRNGSTNLSSGQDPEAMKQNVRALGEVIKAWNTETDAQAARDKAKKK